ncbi:MAG TPA: hypothetical protein VGO62_06475, partial [Myxococcota bacterium]
MAIDSVTVAVAAVVALAFTIEGALGFGATVVALALGALVAPHRDLLPSLVPANMLLSLSIAARGFRVIDKRLLLTGIVPFMALGLPAGLALARVVDGGMLARAFGALVVTLAVLQLVRSLRSSAPAPLSVLAR